jgi:hypothetical protein
VSCTTLLTSVAGSRVIHWSTGTTSTFSYITTIDDVEGALFTATEVGSITAGEFAGHTALGTVTMTDGAFANCGTTGVPSTGGPVTLEIAG